MNGHVSGHHAYLTVLTRPPGQPGVSLEFAVDTGFVGFLTLPPSAIQAMNLPFVRRIPANLADDSTIHVSVHSLTIEWSGEEREVEVLATGSRPLLGTLLLDGFELLAQFMDGGLVTAEPL
jgi:clan AA aspartic protease